MGELFEKSSPTPLQKLPNKITKKIRQSCNGRSTRGETSLLLSLAARHLQDPIRSESCFPMVSKLKGVLLYEH